MPAALDVVFVWIADRLTGPMAKLIDEFRRGWQGTSQPSPLFGAGFAACCLALSTAARWGLSLIRPDVFFTPYLPAVFFATAVGGLRVGIATALASGVLGVTVNFGDTAADSARLALLLIYLIVCGLTIWGIEHYRTIVSQQREISKRLIREEGYRKLVVNELQHRLKNKLSTIHAVLHQVLYDQPQVWANIDHRMRALSATDDLIAEVDGSGCDIKDLLLSELGPYGHVRFTLNGDPLFLPDKLAVSLALMFHELATNAGKYGAFSSPRGLLQVSWSVADDRLNITWDETEGPAVESVGRAGFGTRLLKSALQAFDGKTEIAFLKSGVHCTMQCRIPKS
jgi:two-component sensor histidine kinase